MTERQAVHEVSSPDAKISVRFSVAPDGRAWYSVSLEGLPVLAPSRLGLVRQDADFSSALALVSAGKVTRVREKYRLGYGKRRRCLFRANERVFRLRGADGGRLDIVFRVSNDGCGFRYRFPDASRAAVSITAEATSFRFPPGTRAWMHHCPDSRTGWCRTQPSYEEHYRMGIDVGTPAPFPAGWVLPALFESNGRWLVLTEAAVDRHSCGSRLGRRSDGGEYTIALPQATEGLPNGPVRPQSALPWRSSWRVIGIGESLAAIAESTLGTDLADPAAFNASAYARPGRAAWSWVILKDEATTFPVQKDFIDWAAALGWEYCLIDALWDAQIGYDRMRELVDYARRQRVGIFLWYNSAGGWNTTPQTPRDRLLTAESRAAEFRILRDLGVRGIKVDFFGGDGQSMIAYYLDILADAHRFRLMVNFHGSTFPRGWQRTWPNLMNMEAVRGFEYITFAQENADAAPAHGCVLPFTRNLYDTMDFTPMNLSGVPGIERRTTAGYELATAVVFVAGVQHFAETPAGLATVPAEVRRFLRDLPAAWDEMKFIDGFPGKLAIIARRAGRRWYVAALNGEAVAKTGTIGLDFASGRRSGLFLGDGEAPGSFAFKRILLSGDRRLDYELPPYGGFVLVLGRGRPWSGRGPANKDPAS